MSHPSRFRPLFPCSRALGRARGTRVPRPQLMETASPRSGSPRVSGESVAPADILNGGTGAQYDFFDFRADRARSDSAGLHLGSLANPLSFSPDLPRALLFCLGRLPVADIPIYLSCRHLRVHRDQVVDGGPGAWKSARGRTGTQRAAAAVCADAKAGTIADHETGNTAVA